MAVIQNADDRLRRCDANHHQIAAEASPTAFVRLRSCVDRKRLGDREEHGAARGVAGERRGDQQVEAEHAVRKPKRRLPEARDEQEPDAFPGPRVGDSPCDHEGDDDQKDEAFGESRVGLFYARSV
jgi:hypothetical protein